MVAAARPPFLEPVQGAATARDAASVEQPGGEPMSDHAEVHADLPEDEPVPAMQQLLDNPFLLLFIGIAMPTVLYIVWGVMEIVGIPVTK
jgi:hypothetical protein